jgi:hypothetical protein
MMTHTGRWSDVAQSREGERSPIFIVGAPRSGTSVVGRIVGLSPDISIFEETGLFSLVYARRNPFRAHALQRQMGLFADNSLGCAAANLSDRLRGIDRFRNLLRRMLAYTRVQDYDLNPSDALIDTQGVQLDVEDEELLGMLHEKYRSLMSTDFGFVIGILLRDFRVLAGRNRIAEKTPTHFLYLPPMLRLFPSAKVVFVSRGAREVLASYIGTFASRHTSWKRAARHIHRLWIHARDAAEFYAEDRRVLNVEYDDLVTGTIDTVRQIYGFLDASPPADDGRKLTDVERTPSRSQTLSEVQNRYLERLLSRAPAGG